MSGMTNLAALFFCCEYVEITTMFTNGKYTED